MNITNDNDWVKAREDVAGGYFGYWNENLIGLWMIVQVTNGEHKYQRGQNDDKTTAITEFTTAWSNRAAGTYTEWANFQNKKY